MQTPALTAIFALLAGPALAHTGPGAAESLLHGLLHPVLGPDHLLAMLAVGLWSGFVLRGRAWVGGATFLAAMAVGAGLSWAGVPFAGVEAMILGSVVLFGLLALLARPGQGAAVTITSLATIAAFAACHGHAHATEATGAVAPYLAGFLFSTAALHLVGIALAQASAVPMIRQGMGALIAASGLAMLAG